MLFLKPKRGSDSFLTPLFLYKKFVRFYWRSIWPQIWRWIHVGDEADSSNFINYTEPREGLDNASTATR